MQNSMLNLASSPVFGWGWISAVGRPSFFRDVGVSVKVVLRNRRAGAATSLSALSLVAQTVLWALVLLLILQVAAIVLGNLQAGVLGVG